MADNGTLPPVDPSYAKCARCLWPQRVCLCADIPTIATRTRIVIIRHHNEAHRSSNTGRLAAFALTNSEIVDHGGRDGPAVLPPLAGGWVLYPAGEPRTVAPVPPPHTLVVLDATWSQARRMYRKLEALRGVPVLHLAAGAMSAGRLRASPGPGMVSTIEAIAGALRLLEGAGPADALDRLFATAVSRAQAMGKLAP